MNFKSFLFGCIAIVFYSCGSLSTNVNLKGIITNPKEREVRLIFPDTTYTASLDSSNTFNLELSIESPEFVRFSHGNESSLIYLMPDSKLNLTIDTKEFDETIALTGTNSEPSNYLLDQYLLDENLPALFDHTNLPPDKFISKLDSVISAKTTLLDKYENLPIEFKKIERDKLKYERKAFMGIYLFYDEYGDEEIPDNFYDFNKNIDFNREDLISFYAYIDLLYREISTIAKDGNYSYKVYNNYPNFSNDFLAIADTMIENKSVLSEVVQYHLNGAKLNMKVSDLEYHLNRYKTILPTPFISSLEKDIERLKNLQPGSQVPDLIFYTMNGDSTSFEAFRGKLVYIDLWATWCKPCIAEQPMMETLIHKYKEEPIEFVSISIDSSIEPWKKMVEENNLAGTHLYAKGDWESEIIEHFVVMGIPHYILLDKEGKIIDKNAKRPSGGIEEVILQHLNNT